ncbi:putative 2OG-Fe(II) oxygenase [Novosphingopyxis baekryungensis]|uniref:putative 2OG-Fe(II) oxygenase n=1 Tax=Novosphingopyxis baekryungensis TaxID=279369 RepID=UPI00040E63F1|nr:putative 2OG-Fe(II) oxygenase [Novosphingopyxis baekryungensis]
MAAIALDPYLDSVDVNNVGAVLTAGLAAVRLGAGAPVDKLARRALRKAPNNPGLWQLLGLAARNAQDSRTAVKAFCNANKLAPKDPLIAQSYAQSVLEAGLPALDLFDRAASLAPPNGPLLLGRAAAQVAEGAAHIAARDLAAMLQNNPMWLDGHRVYSKIVGQLEKLGDPAHTWRAAITQHGRSEQLHHGFVSLALEQKDYEAAQHRLSIAATMLGENAWIKRLRAHCASETGDLALAEKLFNLTVPTHEQDDVIYRVRHLIRSGSLHKASQFLASFPLNHFDGALWPYWALIWRASGDPRWDWLAGDDRFVQTYDLEKEARSIGGLAELLRKLHFADREPLDQSVRLGTQTDGPLLSRIEPEILALRSLLLKTVDIYLSQLPEPDPSHPLLSARRGPVRFAGSWSVRLTGKGHHVDHVHSLGWISSAFYVSIPETMANPAAWNPYAGWLNLGASSELLPILEPVRLVEPKPWRLVLFPSTMWHGTRPFAKGERLTVAFDVARPVEF